MQFSGILLFGQMMKLSHWGFLSSSFAFDFFLWHNKAGRKVCFLSLHAKQTWMIQKSVTIQRNQMIKTDSCLVVTTDIQIFTKGEQDDWGPLFFLFTNRHSPEFEETKDESTSSFRAISARGPQLLGQIVATFCCRLSPPTLCHSRLPFGAASWD